MRKQNCSFEIVLFSLWTWNKVSKYSYWSTNSTYSFVITVTKIKHIYLFRPKPCCFVHSCYNYSRGKHAHFMSEPQGCYKVMTNIIFFLNLHYLFKIFKNAIRVQPSLLTNYQQLLPHLMQGIFKCTTIGKKYRPGCKKLLHKFFAFVLSKNWQNL